ncbi:MAG TPA: phenylalanine--tRNA ligase subunit beta [Geobacteraceae bacterium]
MKVSYNWLKEFVDFSHSPDELAHLLTMLGLEVEGVERIGEGLDEVVVARVLEKAQHPNADKLSLCKVDNGREVLAVVCGAQNFQSGDTVALAQVGAVLPGDFKIKRSKIRGEESCGMLCSEKELGLAEESAGIMVLAADLPLGQPLFAALGLKDTVFEIGLTPNRADCLSVIGIAREIAAKLGTTVKYAHPRVAENTTPITAVASVTIEDPEHCPRYAARYISGCTIGPSPAWLVSRLQAVGQRSINNVVDVTNYVLMEYGHPLHAFDHEQLAEGRIVVRRADEGELFTTLDGQERPLNASDLTIRDGSRAVALAGIMGGQNSEISDATSNILLESAYFNPSVIRKTGKRLGLHTESSHRFERGADVNILPVALDRAASLIAELAGGSVASGVIDVYPFPVPENYVAVRVSRVNALLGLTLTAGEIARLFTSLECAVSAVDAELLQVRVPSFRVDIEREIDLIEEVARLHGYEQIPVTMPLARVESDRLPRSQRLEKELKNLMVGLGFNEVINFSFASPIESERLRLPAEDPRRATVRLMNPLVDEHSVMRTSLAPSLLSTAASNFNMRSLDLRLFEMRRVYRPIEHQELPHEPLYLAGLMAGARAPDGWNQDKSQMDFYDLKGVAETILAAFRLPPVSWLADTPEPFYHPGKSCTLVCQGVSLGSFGEVHPDVQESFDLEKTVYYFEFDFERLVAASRETPAISAPSRFPDTTRDCAMLIAEEVSGQTVIDTVNALRLDKMIGVEIFDLYRGEHVPAGKKSVAIRCRYGSVERTLTDEEVNKLQQKVVDALITKIGATIR